MTYILYHILRRIPRPLLVALLVVLMSGLARAQVGSGSLNIGL